MNKTKYFDAKRNKFSRDLLPNPGSYFREQGMKLIGGGEWKSTLCPFHKEKNPSLRVRLDSGGFICMSCSVKGGDVLDFHMKLYKIDFITAAKQLGAWKDRS